jgi:hypothetical protein
VAKHKPGARPAHVRRVEPERKRSYEAPLWALGAALVIGYPILRDATADRMVRNTYANSSSCVCAYSMDQCARSGDRWVGPWYAASAADRDASDPGEGRRCAAGGSGSSGGAYYSGGANDRDGVGPRTGVEKGYRGGFGATGRVRAAGS